MNNLLNELDFNFYKKDIPYLSKYNVLTNKGAINNELSNFIKENITHLTIVNKYDKNKKKLF
jgi:hypothetical protein